MRTVTFGLVLLILFAAVPATHAGQATSPEQNNERPIPTIAAPGNVLTSGGSSLALRETAGPDTFTIYGGPDEPTEGKFQMADPNIADWGGGNGLPGGYGGGPGAWTPLDETYHDNYWQRSQFNAANLNNHGAGNHAIWCGLDAGDPLTANWASPPGYGNNWDQILMYESAPVADTSVGQVVALDFWFNHDSEPGYDFFMVEFDSAGIWTEVLGLDGTNETGGSFPAPGVSFSSVATGTIQYAGNDYGGLDNDQIRIRLRFTSDGAFSDEDVFFDTLGGAVQVDDISLTTSHGNEFEDFEGPGPYLFQPAPAPFAGDYSDVYSLMTDVDPCRHNTTGLAAFIDTGQIVRNGPGTTGLVSTGGTTNEYLNYGVPGGYVVNHNGGLSLNKVNLANSIVSPDILWDQPGPGDDDAAFAGARLSFDVWKDLPIHNGIFYVWWVRSAQPGEEHTQWRNRNFVHYGGGNSITSGPAGWFRHVEVVSDLLQDGPERVQIRLACWDLAEVFGFPGVVSTPSPWFDNVRFDKIRLAGPTLATRQIDLAQDGFPVSGSIDVSSQLTRDALDVPFSMARDINTGDFTITPGDSIIVDVSAVIPFTLTTDIRMIWALQTNPLFEDAIRSAPARTVDAAVVAGPAGSVWSGEVEARASTTAGGFPVENRYYVDLPDLDFMYPGDVLHYYIQATDSDGRTSTLPADISGFGDFSHDTPFDRVFQVRALPTLEDSSGSQPEVLVYNQAGRPGSEAEWRSALGQLGYLEGIEYDTYTVLGATSRVSNGIGSVGGHGATSDQLLGYEHILHFAGRLSTEIFAGGEGGWSGENKGDDVATLRGWLDTPTSRNIAHFGDGIATGGVQNQPGFEYVRDVMGVDAHDSDVSDVIGGQTAPRINPTHQGTYAGIFDTWYVAYGGCNLINTFDQIRPRVLAEAGHYFLNTDGFPVTGSHAGVASVVSPLANGYAFTFPYNIGAVRNSQNRSVGLAARAGLLWDVLQLFGSQPPIIAVGAPPVLRDAQLSASPNPFNPSTTIEFTAAIGSRGSIRIYNLRGELVRTLHEGEFTATTFSWDGLDNQGAGVASGVYVVRAEDGRVSRNGKVALVK